MHHLSVYFDKIYRTTAKIPEVEFGVKYRYVRANEDKYGYLSRIFPHDNNQH